MWIVCKIMRTLRVRPARTHHSLKLEVKKAKTRRLRQAAWYEACTEHWRRYLSHTLNACPEHELTSMSLRQVRYWEAISAVTIQCRSPSNALAIASCSLRCITRTPFRASLALCRVYITHVEHSFCTSAAQYFALTPVFICCNHRYCRHVATRRLRCRA